MLLLLPIIVKSNTITVTTLNDATQNIDCNDNEPCIVSVQYPIYGLWNTIIHCPTNSTCNITCDEDCGGTVIANTSTRLDISCNDNQGCKRAIFICPINGPCNIRCMNDEACARSKITWPLDHYNAYLYCAKTMYTACEEITLPLPPPTDDFVMVCTVYFAFAVFHLFLEPNIAKYLHVERDVENPMKHQYTSQAVVD